MVNGELVEQELEEHRERSTGAGCLLFLLIILALIGVFFWVLLN